MQPGGAVGGSPVGSGSGESYLAAAGSIPIIGDAGLISGGVALTSMAAANSDHIVMAISYSQPKAVATMSQLTLSVK